MALSAAQIAKASKILKSLQTAGDSSVTGLVTNTGISEASVLFLMPILATADHADNPDKVGYVDDLAGDGSVYSFVQYGATIKEPVDADPDVAAIAALEAEVCNPEECKNDVVVTLTASGNTLEAWTQGEKNIGGLLEMLRCAGLRNRLIDSGVDIAKIDMMLDRADAAHLVNNAMIQRHGNDAV